MLTHLEKNRSFSLILTLIIAGIIYYLSSLEFSSSTGGGFIVLPYIYHFGIFFLFALFLLITIKGEKEKEKHHIILVLTIATIYAALDEFHQSFISGRNASAIDLLIDVIGISLAIIFYDKLKKMKILKKFGLRNKN